MTTEPDRGVWACLWTGDDEQEACGEVYEPELVGHDCDGLVACLQCTNSLTWLPELTREHIPHIIGPRREATV